MSSPQGQKILLILNHLFFYVRNMKVTREALANDPKLTNKQVLKAIDKVTNSTEELIEMIREKYPEEALMARDIWQETTRK